MNPLTTLPVGPCTRPTAHPKNPRHVPWRAVQHGAAGKEPEVPTAGPTATRSGVPRFDRGRALTPRKPIQVSSLRAGLLVLLTAAATAAQGPIQPRGSTVGPGTGSRFGSAVVIVGDVNGDGRPDYVGGAPAAQSNAGYLQAVSGANGTTLWSRSGAAGEELGTSLAAIGDVNGDGIADLAAGAPGYNGTRGRVLILDGSDGSLLAASAGNGVGHRKGQAVAAAGDLSGDGVPDVLVGVPGWFSGDGLVDLVNGQTGAVVRSWGGANREQLGMAVAGGFDVTGDGVFDVALGAPSASFAGTFSGSVYLKSGAGGDLVRKDGTANNDRFGTSITFLPNTTGGTKPVLAVGATMLGTLGGSSGPGFVRFFHCEAALGYPILRTILGSANGDRFGSSLAPAGDIDQDRVPDLLVGAPQLGLLGATGPGYVRILSGADSTVLGSISGNLTGDALGAAVSGGADVNGDGLYDFVAGATGADIAFYSDVGTLRAFSPMAAPNLRRVLLTEVAWGEPDGVEIMNFGLAAVDLAGWSVRWRTGSSTWTLALSGTLEPGAALVAVEGGAPVIAEMPPGTPLATVAANFVVNNLAMSVALVAKNGLVVDEVRITDSVGGGTPPALGGLFRGVVVRDATHVVAERLGNLDSNCGADWTVETVRSFGLQNRGSGPRGTDPLAPSPVRINEVATLATGGFVELENHGSAAVDVGGYLLYTGSGWMTLARTRPFPASTPLPAGGFAVIGNTLAPAGLPAGVPYANASGGLGDVPDLYYAGALTCALLDPYGRLVDLVLGANSMGTVVSPGESAPRHWRDFIGLAPWRNAAGGLTLARLPGPDTDAGSDWSAVSAPTLGAANAFFAGPAGLADPLVAAVDELPAGYGLGLVLNAGSAQAGLVWNVLVSPMHWYGTGPVFGIGLDAFSIWYELQAANFFFPLDARGSARVDLPVSLSGATLDLLFFLRTANGGFGPRTPVQMFDG